MRPQWDNQFRETETERNARLRQKRLRRQTPAQMQAAVDRFNAAHPVGSPIRIWKGVMGDGPGIETTVAEPGAFILSGHTAVVKVPGDSIALTHVQPV